MVKTIIGYLRPEENGACFKFDEFYWKKLWERLSKF